MNNFHITYFGSLTITQSFENYRLALQKHERELEIAAQNYGGWNYSHSTSAMVKEFRQALLFAFNGGGV